MNDVAKIQKRLTELGFKPGSIDGRMGPKTKAAIRAFQRINGLISDGIAGPKTRNELWPDTIPHRDRDPILPKPLFGKWPRQKHVRRYFGAPGTNLGFAKLPYSMKLAWNNNISVSRIQCNVKVIRPVESIFGATLDHYGIKEVRRLRLDQFGGCFNDRPMRGGTRKSMHAYAIAIDMDPLNNRLKWGRNRASFARPEYLPFWEIVEAQGAISLGRERNFDWMHFQFARL